MRVNNIKSFIKRSREIHGDKYDYSLAIYKGTIIPVKIICPIHGIFEEAPRDHLQKHGCRACFEERRLRKNQLVDNKRKCVKCGEYFDLNCFYADASISDGLSSWCKLCSNKASDDWKSRNLEMVISKRKEYDKKRWAKYKEEHKEEFEQRALEREKRHQECVLLDKLKRRLKARLQDAIGRNSDNPHVKDLLGCSLTEFREHIESKWLDDMTWDNNTYFGWHFDHIRPCASFPNLLTDIEEQKQCFHYTNYQPLWRKLNQTKSAKYEGIDYRRYKI